MRQESEIEQKHFTFVVTSIETDGNCLKSWKSLSANECSGQRAIITIYCSNLITFFVRPNKFTPRHNLQEIYKTLLYNAILQFLS